MVPLDTRGKEAEEKSSEIPMAGQHGVSQRLWTPALALCLGHIPYLRAPLESEQEDGRAPFPRPQAVKGCQGRALLVG